VLEAGGLTNAPAALKEFVVDTDVDQLLVHN
jgi:hypothetical protein